MIYERIFGGNIMEHFKRGVFLTLIGGTCWGFSGASGQFLFTHYQANPMWLTSMRMCFAGLLITLFGALTQKEAMKRLVSQKKDLLKTFGFGFVLMLCQFTYLQAINTSNAGTATVLQYLSPIYIMIFVCFTSKRLPNKIEALCIVLALGGAFVIATHGRLNGLALTPTGLFWGIFCGFTAAAYSIYPKRLMAVYGSVPVTGIGMLFGGIVLLCAGKTWTLVPALDLAGVLATIGIIVIGTAVAFTLYLQGVVDIGPVKASMIASIEPVSATLFAFVWLSTPFKGIDLIGFAMILVTIFLLALPSDQVSNS